MNETFARILIDVSIFLEFTDDEVLDPDVSLQMSELIGARLRQLSDTDRFALTEALRGNGETAYEDFVNALPEHYGLVG